MLFEALRAALGCWRWQVILHPATRRLGGWGRVQVCVFVKNVPALLEKWKLKWKTQCTFWRPLKIMLTLEQVSQRQVRICATGDRRFDKPQSPRSFLLHPQQAKPASPPACQHAWIDAETRQPSPHSAELSGLWESWSGSGEGLDPFSLELSPGGAPGGRGWPGEGGGWRANQKARRTSCPRRAGGD